MNYNFRLINNYFFEVRSMNKSRLTSKQMKFIRIYLTDGNDNGATSARLAGYSANSAKQTANRLLRTTSVIIYGGWFSRLLRESPNVPPKYNLIKSLILLGITKIGITPISDYIDNAKANGNLTNSVLSPSLLEAQVKEHAKAERYGLTIDGKHYHLS